MLHHLYAFRVLTNSGNVFPSLDIIGYVQWIIFSTFIGQWIPSTKPAVYINDIVAPILFDNVYIQEGLQDQA
jgi:hypothetical protein